MKNDGTATRERATCTTQLVAEMPLGQAARGGGDTTAMMGWGMNRGATTGADSTGEIGSIASETDPASTCVQQQKQSSSGTAGRSGADASFFVAA